MKLTLVNLYPQDTVAKYQLSSYVLKAYIDKHYGWDDLSIGVLNFKNTADVSEIAGRVAAEGSDYIGYSCYIWNIEKILDVIRVLRGTAQATHILGGPEISPGRIFNFNRASAGDYYVIGEGEKILLNLMNYLRLKKNGLQPEIPDGVACWDNNNLVYSQNRDGILNLDDIPSIYINGVIEDRLYANRQAFIETQRGCRFRCKYCVYHKNLQSISYYSLQRIYDELEHLIVKKKIMALRIFDAVFTSNISRAKEIVRYICGLKKKEGIRLPWIYWEMTYHNIDLEFIELCSSLKCREEISNSEELAPLDNPQHYYDMLKDYTAINCIGVQSFNNSALRAVQRMGVNIKMFTNFMETVRRYNLVLKVDMILGLPLETFETYFKGLELILPFFRKTDHVLCISLLQILPGSDLEELCGTYGIRYSAEAPHIVYSTNTFPEERLAYASKLSAVLFRVLNSPLRERFFRARELLRKSSFDLVTDIFNAISASPELNDIYLVRADTVDDDYWNNKIYHDVPSQWLSDCLDRVKK